MGTNNIFNHGSLQSLNFLEHYCYDLPLSQKEMYSKQMQTSMTQQYFRSIPLEQQTASTHYNYLRKTIKPSSFTRDQRTARCVKCNCLICANLFGKMQLLDLCESIWYNIFQYLQNDEMYFTLRNVCRLIKCYADAYLQIDYSFLLVQGCRSKRSIGLCTSVNFNEIISSTIINVFRKHFFRFSQICFGSFRPQSPLGDKRFSSITEN